mgnify:FL=1|jgi:hypothetical protein
MPNTPNPPDVSGKRKVKFTPRMRNVLGVVGRKSEITGEPVSASEQKRLLAKKVKDGGSSKPEIRGYGMARGGKACKMM